MTQLLEIVSNNLLTDGFGDTFDVPSTIAMWIIWTLSAGAVAAMIHVWVKLHNIEKQKSKRVNIALMVLNLLCLMVATYYNTTVFIAILVYVRNYAITRKVINHV